MLLILALCCDVTDQFIGSRRMSTHDIVERNLISLRHNNTENYRDYSYYSPRTLHIIDAFLIFRHSIAIASLQKPHSMKVEVKICKMLLHKRIPIINEPILVNVLNIEGKLSKNIIICIMDLFLASSISYVLFFNICSDDEKSE